MIALAVIAQTLGLALNVALIERGSVFESEAAGVSWVNVAASLFIAVCIGFTVRSLAD